MVAVDTVAKLTGTKLEENSICSVLSSKAINLHSK